MYKDRYEVTLTVRISGNSPGEALAELERRLCPGPVTGDERSVVVKGSNIKPHISKPGDR